MSDRILYHSSNRRLAGTGSTLTATFRGALFQGIAPDGGLYMPTRIPCLSRNEIEDLRGYAYQDLAFHILKSFLYDDIPDDSLKTITREAYDFAIPIERFDTKTYLIRLDRGPTASFKDFAARFMARVMDYLKDSDRKITILVATSGDTGSAVGNAYKGLDGFQVFILYPETEVSAIQKKQLDSIGGNVQAIAMDGKFDDCQKLVKQAFADADLSDLNLTSANSINIGRLLPQIIYYFYAYLKITVDFEPVIFSIPSGNFGNSLGCEFARRMGLPVEKIILAVNENDEFPRLLETGKYFKIDPSRACLSNAMNVGNPSNLARYFDLYGGVVDKNGTVHIDPDIVSMKQYLASVSVNDKETVDTIKHTYQRYGIILEPHGAVGLSALDKYRELFESQLSICLETAHPAKFPDLVEKTIGIKPAFPESLRKYQARNSKVDYIKNDYISLKSYLKEKLEKM